jgi:hypothetical protein
MGVSKSIVVLTNSESKRLIAKGIAKLPEVQIAYKNGLIGLPLCTTNAYIYEELRSTKVVNKSKYCCGYICGKGFCKVNSNEMLPEIVFCKSKEIHIDFSKGNLLPYVKEMSSQDIIIKSGNILDKNLKAGLLVGEKDGGEFGNILPYILAKGIQLIVPMTINKSAPTVIENIISELGIETIERSFCHGRPVGMLPMPGKIFTEVDAFKILAEVVAIPIAMSGIGEEGCVTLLLKAEKEKLELAWDIITEIKGEPKLKPIPNCKNCSFEQGKSCIL